MSNNPDDSLTLEKLKISERIQKMEVAFVEINGTMKLLKQSMDNMNTVVESHSNEIWGKGNGSPGMKMKVDRIIQWKKLTNLGIIFIFTTLFGIVTRIGYEIYIKG